MHTHTSPRATLATVVAALSCATIAHAEFISIDFNEEFYPSEAPFVFLTDQLEPEYGVRFSNPEPGESVRWFRPGTTIFSGALATRDPFAAPPFAYPLRIDFTELVNAVQMRAFDGGGDVDILNMRAYDTSGILVDHAQVIDDFGVPGRTISVFADEIAYVELSVEANTSGVFFDDLAFNTVPAPSSAAILAISALGIRRRR